MRIISGKHRGRKIETVSSKKLRPTTGMAREALFNILSHGRFADGETPFLQDCKVLDLYCGCGALSMEALSRGAAHVVLLDIDQDHLDVARHNIKTIGEIEHATFIRADSSTPPPARFPCNLIFVDPPYGNNLADKTLKNLIKGNWLADKAVIIVETGKTEELDLPEGFTEIDDRRYGNCRIRIFEWNKNA